MAASPQTYSVFDVVGYPALTDLMKTNRECQIDRAFVQFYDSRKSRAWETAVKAALNEVRDKLVLVRCDVASEDLSSEFWPDLLPDGVPTLLKWCEQRTKVWLNPEDGDDVKKSLVKKLFLKTEINKQLLAEDARTKRMLEGRPRQLKDS